MTLAPADRPPISAIASWFGGNRTLAPNVAVQLGDLRWCGVPFCGGCPELPWIRTRGGVASDLHRHIINLALTIKSDELRPRLIERLDRTLFHPDELEAARVECRTRELDEAESLHRGRARHGMPDLDWAYAYFVSVWMGAGGIAGKATEFKGAISTRWTSSGGDSARRFRSAAASIEWWSRALAPWSFEVCDAFGFLARCRDEDGHGLYIDAPWPDAGAEYKHPFTWDHVRRLAAVLGRFGATRVVVRFGDHPLVRELFPEGRWSWLRQASVNQHGNEVCEALIVNGPLAPEVRP